MSWQPTESETAPHEAAAHEVMRLLALMARLRAPGGCPWDRKQTHESLRPYLLEETHEVLEAIDLGDDDDLQEELGDLLLQVVFHAELAREDGRWSMAEVAAGITDKLHFRHPHVFGGADAADAEAALSRWEQRKAEEKAAKGKARKSVLEGVPKAAPALMRAERLTDKAASVGFDWPEQGGARAKVTEELDELDEAIASGDRAAIEHELGDLLFSVVNLARWLKVHPEDALRGTIERFTRRFGHVEETLAAGGQAPADVDLARLDALWDEAKARHG
jgi:MazG family protein